MNKKYIFSYILKKPIINQNFSNFLAKYDLLISNVFKIV